MICKYISDSFYDSRLISHPITNKRKLDLKLKDIGNKGIFYIPTEHFGTHRDQMKKQTLFMNTIKK